MLDVTLPEPVTSTAWTDRTTHSHGVVTIDDSGGTDRPALTGGGR